MALSSDWYFKILNFSFVKFFNIVLGMEEIISSTKMVSWPSHLTAPLQFWNYFVKFFNIEILHFRLFSFSSPFTGGDRQRGGTTLIGTPKWFEHVPKILIDFATWEESKFATHIYSLVQNSPYLRYWYVASNVKWIFHHPVFPINHQKIKTCN
jgi:hypothetical protein